MKNGHDTKMEGTTKDTSQQMATEVANQCKSAQGGTHKSSSGGTAKTGKGY